eukprot:692333_1
MPSILGWTLFTITSMTRLILCGFITYYGHKFYIFRHCQALQKRYPPFIYFGSILVLIYLVIVRSCFELSFIYFFTGSQTASDINIRKVLVLIGVIFYAISLHGMILLMIVRTWIVYFKMKFGAQMQQQKWSVYIDPSETSNTSLWFMEHQKTFGSYRYIAIVLFIYYLIEAALLLSLGLFAMHLYNVIDSGLLLIKVILLVVMWCKIPAFYDTFGLKNELRYVLFSGGIGLMLYILWIVLDMILGRNVWIYFVFNLTQSICVGSTVIIFNSYIFVSKYKGSIQFTDDADVNGKTLTIGLSDTLKHDHLIGAFANHLLDEWSVELILSFIEFNQFKQLMENDEKETTILSEKVPQSYIVFEKHKNASDTERYKLIANDLFEKYVSRTAELQINISYDQQNYVFAKLNGINVNENELYTLFDGCSHTVHALMKHAHRRFIKRTHLYCTIRMPEN